jgi:uncharacterized protein (TIGR03086 family)
MGEDRPMSEISDRYRRLAEGFTARVAAVPDEDPRWADPSPCDDWTARDVVAHLVGAHQLFFGFIELDVPPAPDPADGALPAWEHVRDAMQSALDDPATATKEFDGMLGRSRFEDAANRFVTADVLIHTWDLARAMGLDDRLPEDEIAPTRAGLEGLGDSMRQPGVFGPEVEPPADADPQDRLLAFLGRDPRFGPSA